MPGARALLASLALIALTVCGGASLPFRAPPDLPLDDVVLRSGSGSTLRGWFATGRAGGGAVLLLHGIGASRLDMVDRARFLRSAGFSVLLIDFRGHGESSAAEPTYGGLESRDADVALAFLRRAAPRERVGVIGVSMGGAATLVGPAPAAVDALVLESVYPTIEAAVRDRLRAWLGPVGGALAPGMLGWLFPRQGVAAGSLRPIDRIAEVHAPVLVLAGAADPYTPLPESVALFERAPSPKEFWAVEGAGHEDLHAFAPAEYERRVSAFLARNLQASRADLAAGSGDGRGAAPEPEDDPQRPARGDRGAGGERQAE
jgi:uncharacterized protein